MTKKILLLSLFFCEYALAQTNPIDPSRRIDWSNAGVTGGIPNRTTIYTTLSPGADDTQINNALASCPAGQVVKLNAGTYNLSAGIDFNGKSNVTLRGAGPDQTFLKFTGGCTCRGMGADICVGAADNSYYVVTPTYIVNWTAGYTKGATQITLSDTAGLSPGMVMVIDQLNYDTDTGGVYICETDGICADEGPAGGEQPDRAQEQFVKVTAINGYTVTISPGLYMPNWNASQSPHAWWGNASGYSFGLGVEDLSIDNTTDTSSSSDIYLIWCYDCWVKNVRDINSDRNHVWLYEAAHSTVRDSYFYGTQNAQSRSYGVESFMGSDNLVENNIFQHIAGPLMDGGAVPGLVEAYNYAIDDYYTSSLSWMQGSNYAHGAGDGYILHEGNDGVGFTSDLAHGSHNFLTAFRNYFTGWEPGKTEQTIPVNLYAFSRYFNIVGNVLGTAGYHDNYESAPPLFNGYETSIYRLGDQGNVLPVSKQDTLVESTLFRWGNYDVVTNSSRFLASEVPSGLSQFANPVPANQTLPHSLYLSSTPSWWPPAIPYPPIGPDVIGGNVSGYNGHYNKNPAHVCYENTAVDYNYGSNHILLFNANNCYGITANIRENLRSEQQIKIYPNPAHDKIYFDKLSAVVSLINLSIYTIDGKIAAKKILNLQTEKSFDISDLPAGMYFVQITNESINANYKIVIAH